MSLSLIGRLLAAPVSEPIRGVIGLARLIEGQVVAEIYDEDKIRGALAELELKLDLEEIDLAEYEAQEDILLQRLNEIREMKRDG